MIRDLIANEPLDGRTLRYARSGIFLARHRYADPRQWWTRTKALYGALCVNPAASDPSRFPKKGAFAGARANMEAIVAGQSVPWLKTKRHMILLRMRCDFYLYLHI